MLSTPYIKFLHRLRLGLSHLRECESKHSYLDTINPCCDCCIEPESALHYFLHCSHFNNLRATLLNKIREVDINILSKCETEIVHDLLFGNPLYSNDVNIKILNSTLDYIVTTDRFSGSLY